MKRVLKKSLFLCCCVCVCACGQPEQNEVIEEDSGALSITFVPSSEDIPQEESSDFKEETDDFYIIMEQEESVDVALCNAMNRKLSREKIVVLLCFV